MYVKGNDNVFHGAGWSMRCPKKPFLFFQPGINPIHISAATIDWQHDPSDCLILLLQFGRINPYNKLRISQRLLYLG